jgi:hypothetical protein
VTAAARFALPVLFALAAAGQPKGSVEIQHIKTVYILPMPYGYDQYLANRLTRDGVFQVVTDPQKADGVLTDRLGKSFEDRMEELYPAPKPEPPAGEEKKAASADTAGQSMKHVGEQRMQTSSRSRGTVFLVHRATRNVVWSSWDQPEDLRPETLNRTAGRVASRLSAALKQSAASVK